MGVFGSLPIRSPLSCLWWYSENFVSPQLLTATSAHIEKHLLNSGRLRGLMPTHTEKQTILSTHRRNADTNVPTQAPPRKKKKNAPIGTHRQHKHPHTQKHSDTRDAQSYRHALEHHDAGSAHTHHTKSPWVLSLGDTPPYPRPTRRPTGSASAHPGCPSLRGGLRFPVLSLFLLLRLKMYKTLLRINPRLLAPPGPPPGSRSPIHFRPSPGKSLPPRSPASAAPRPETAAHLDFPLHSLPASLPGPTAAN